MKSGFGLKLLLLLPMAIVAAAPLAGQENGVIGYWKEPQGSVIHVETCGQNVCATLVAISPSAPARIDGKNPDRKLRDRSLCGLQGQLRRLCAPGGEFAGGLFIRLSRRR